jgi:PIN domain nuclease of toxin-antitoxin system
MRILLDTHIFLWFISGDARLSIDMRDLIRESDNKLYLSLDRFIRGHIREKTL